MGNTQKSVTIEATNLDVDIAPLSSPAKSTDNNYLVIKRTLNKTSSNNLLDKASMVLENFKLVKDEIEQIFAEIEPRVSQLK